MRVTLFVFCMMCSFCMQYIHAQDGHYWTQQYGTRSMLLSGSVIGGVEDLGAVYYNPARLSQIQNPAFLLSADVYELNRIRVNDAFGENINTSKQDMKGVPSLAAGTFRLPFLKKHSFAWAILLRTNSSLDFSFKDEQQGELISNYPGEEYLGAEMSINQNASDQWTGLNWSYPINDNLSIGMSGFLSLVNQKKGMAIRLNALTESNQTAIYQLRREVNFEQYSLIGKFGVTYKNDKIITGFTLLSPRLFLRGKSSYTYENLFSGIEGVSVEDDMYVTNYQTGLNINYKSTYAIGGGITYLVKKSKIHLSGEWYAPLKKYTLMEVEEHYGQSTNDTLNYRLTDELNSVLNVGLGAELYINEKVSAYLSSSSDFSAVTSDISRFVENTDESANSIFQASYFHFGGGVVLHIKGADITLGGTYTGANQTFKRPLNFPDDSGDSGDDILAGDETAKLEWDRFRLAFSFSLPFLRDVQDKVEDKFGF